MLFYHISDESVSLIVDKQHLLIRLEYLIVSSLELHIALPKEIYFR